MFNCVGGPEAAMLIERYRSAMANQIYANQELDLDTFPRGVIAQVNPADLLAARMEEATINRNIVDSIVQAVHSEGFLSELSRSVEQRIIEARNNCFDNYVDYRYIEPSEGVSVVNDILRSTCSLKDLFENKCEVENGDN